MKKNGYYYRMNFPASVVVGRKWVHITHTPIPGYQPINYKIKMEKWNGIMGSMGRYRARNNLVVKDGEE